MKTRSIVVLVIAGLVVCIAIFTIGGAAWFYAYAYDSNYAGAAEGRAAMTAVRAKFGTTPPIFGMRDNLPVLERPVPTNAPARDLQRLQIITWEPADEQLSRITLPFWLLRIRPGNIHVSLDPDHRGQTLSLTVEDVERYGPALLLDYIEDGKQVLVWTE